MAKPISVKLKLNVDREKLQDLKTVFMNGRLDHLSNKDFLIVLTDFCLHDIEPKIKESFGIYGDDALTLNLCK